MCNLEDGIKHVLNVRVGSQDVDGSGRVRPERIVAMLQEVGDSHLRSYGTDYKTMHDVDKKAFVVSRMTVEFYDDINEYDELKVRTWLTEGKTVNFPRNYDAVCGDKVVLKAYSNWGLIDLESGKFIKFKDHDYANGPFEPAVELEMSERFRIPKDLDMVLDHNFTVRHSQIDMNNHMNNVMYIDPMWDAIPNAGDYVINSLSIRFFHETLLGEEVSVYRSDFVEEDGRKVIYFRLVSGDTVRTEGRWTVDEIK